MNRETDKSNGNRDDSLSMYALESSVLNTKEMEIIGQINDDSSKEEKNLDKRQCR